jgi:hypothetical protein
LITAGIAGDGNASLVKKLLIKSQKIGNGLKEAGIKNKKVRWQSVRTGRGKVKWISIGRAYMSGRNEGDLHIKRQMDSSIGKENAPQAVF